MQRKTGLLPKWLLISTMVRTVCIVFEHGKKILVPDRSRMVLVYPSFFLAYVRLLGVSRLCPFFYVSIAVSYVFETFWFIAAWHIGLFPGSRAVFEVLAALFSLSWMIFLYPYYLLEIDTKHSKDE